MPDLEPFSVEDAIGMLVNRELVGRNTRRVTTCSIGRVAPKCLHQGVDKRTRTALIAPYSCGRPCCGREIAGGRRVSRR